MKTSFILLLTGLACTAPAQTPRLVVPLGNTLSVSAVAFSPACPDDPAGGKYVWTGETVQINGILKKGALKKGSFEVKGAKNNIRDLVEQMVDKVQAMVDGE